MGVLFLLGLFSGELVRGKTSWQSFCAALLRAADLSSAQGFCSQDHPAEDTQHLTFVRCHWAWLVPRLQGRHAGHTGQDPATSSPWKGGLASNSWCSRSTRGSTRGPMCGRCGAAGVKVGLAPTEAKGHNFSWPDLKEGSGPWQAGWARAAGMEPGLINVT